MGTLDADGRHTNSMDEMKLRADDYFTELYSAENRTPPLPNLNIIFGANPTKEVNARLRAYPSGEEI